MASSARHRSYIGRFNSPALRGFGPLVEQVARRGPVTGAQLQLTQVQALQSVRLGLAAVVGLLQQSHEGGSGCAGFAAPYGALSRVRRSPAPARHDLAYPDPGTRGPRRKAAGTARQAQSPDRTT